MLTGISELRASVDRRHALDRESVLEDTRRHRRQCDGRATRWRQSAAMSYRSNSWYVSLQSLHTTVLTYKCRSEWYMDVVQSLQIQGRIQPANNVVTEDRSWRPPRPVCDLHNDGARQGLSDHLQSRILPYEGRVAVGHTEIWALSSLPTSQQRHNVISRRLDPVADHDTQSRPGFGRLSIDANANAWS